MPRPASQHGFHINYKAYPGGNNDCHSTTVPRWDEQASPIFTGPAGQMNTFPSQVGNLQMFDNTELDINYYDVIAKRPTMYTFGWPSKSILRRAMVLYEEKDDFGSIPNNK